MGWDGWHTVLSWLSVGLQPVLVHCLCAVGMGEQIARGLVVGVVSKWMRCTEGVILSLIAVVRGIDCGLGYFVSDSLCLPIAGAWQWVLQNFLHVLH